MGLPFLECRSWHHVGPLMLLSFPSVPCICGSFRAFLGVVAHFILSFKVLTRGFLLLILEREEGRVEEEKGGKRRRERERRQPFASCLHPDGGLNPQPSHEP